MARLTFSRRERAAHLRDRGWCPQPLLSVPSGLGAVGLDYKATCPCGKRVRVTVRGLYAHHKPPAKDQPHAR